MQELTERLDRAEQAHRRLRSVSPGPANLEEKAQVLQEILPVLDEAARAISENPERRAEGGLRQALLALRTDAEFYAGRQTEAEGYRNAEDVWRGYEALRAACSGHA